MIVSSQQLTTEQAVKLARLPLHCINTEFPNKTGHQINDSAEAVMFPSQLHPSFYGCLDWHSSVHGHWMLVKILKQFPDIPLRDSIVSILQNSFMDYKIKAEVDYYVRFKNSNIFERTYGWAWLLKLDQELCTFNNPMAKQWSVTMKPLADKVVELWKEYLKKQTYPSRTGVHPNTAFGLVFALDWARTVKDTVFESMIVHKAREFYLDNVATPAYLEPDGTDFLSPSLEIADLMSRILSGKEFNKWFRKFYEQKSIDNIVKLPMVSDRTDYQIVHLDGLARILPENNKTKFLFEKTSRFFLEQALPNVLSGNYGGEHWLASFALYALSL
jgi:hypothetical protein